VLALKPFVQDLADQDRTWLVLAMSATLAGQNRKNQQTGQPGGEPKDPPEHTWNAINRSRNCEKNCSNGEATGSDALRKRRKSIFGPPHAS
jgi:hypothetical protein